MVLFPPFCVSDRLKFFFFFQYLLSGNVVTTAFHFNFGKLPGNDVGSRIVSHPGNEVKRNEIKKNILSSQVSSDRI